MKMDFGEEVGKEETKDEDRQIEKMSFRGREADREKERGSKKNEGMR